MRGDIIAAVGIIITILGTIFAAGIKVGQIEDRLNTLEASQHYYHGDK